MPYIPLSALGNFQSLKAFVEGDGLADALSRIGLTAAIEALRKASKAQNREAQIWSAVNHLEEAEVALREFIPSVRGKLLAVANIIRTMALINRWKRIVFLMSMCYVYLSEKRLAQEAFRHLEEGIMPKGLGPAVAGIVGFFNPILPVVAVVETARAMILSEDILDDKMPMKELSELIKAL